MKKIVAIATLSVVVAGAVAVGVFERQPAPNGMTADLERDLNLATSVQATRTGVVSAIEQGRNGAPSGNAKGARMVVPTRKKAPTPAVAQTVAAVPVAPPDISPEPAITAPPDVTAPTSVAPTAVEAAVSAPAPDPDATVIAAGGPSVGVSTEGDHSSGDAGRGSDGGHGGVRGTMGGIVGVILRGGSAGDDHCEPAGRGRGGVHPTGGVIGAIGGILSGGNAMPRGSLPGGNRAGRRW